MKPSCFKLYRAYSILFNSSNVGSLFWSWILKDCTKVQEKKKSRCIVFTSSTKLEIRHFHVVVVQWRRRNVQKSAMHVQYCYFANLNLLPFCRSRCRRRWLNSLKRPLTRLKSKLRWRWLLSSVFYMHITCSSSTLLFQIEEEMQNLVNTYPNVATMVTEFGQSYEGRTIRAIKVFYEGVAISLESLKKKGALKNSQSNI